MYKIEFNDEMTIEGVLSSFNNLNEIGIVSYIDINGVIIYGNDDNLEWKIKQEYMKYKEKNEMSIEKIKQEEYVNISKKQEEVFNKILNSRQDLYFLSKDATFLFEIGIVLQYTKEKYKEDMLNYYISIYGNSSKNKEGIELAKNLDYMSNLLLVMNDDSSLIQKQIKIQQIMNSICNDDDEKYKLEIAIGRIEKYIIHGEKIRQLLFLDILNDKLLQKNDEINKILKRTLF